MITPRIDHSIGYICQQDVCDPSASTSGDALHELGMSQYGMSTLELAERRCPEGTAGDGSAWGDSGGGLPGIGGALPGRNLKCVTTKIHGGARGQLLCLAAVTDQVGAPSFGVPDAESNPNCFRPNADGSGTGGGLDSDQQKNADGAKKNAKDKLDFEAMSDEQLQKLAQELGVTVDQLRDSLQTAKDAIDNALPVDDADWGNAPQSCQGAVACVVADKETGDLRILIKKTEFDRTNGELTDTFIEESAHVWFTEAGNKKAGQQHDVIWCQWIVSGCCGNSACGSNKDQFCEFGQCPDTCSPSAAMANALSNCADGDPTGEPFRAPEGGCPGPACDPMPLDDSAATGWADCLSDSSYGQAGSFASTACAAAKCADNQYGAQSAAGCVCTNRDESIQPSFNTCPNIMCPEGGGVAANGQCKCTSTGHDDLTNPPIPPMNSPRVVF